MKSIYAKVSAVMLISALSLSGCGNAVTYMSSEESAMIGEYAAAILLKYDANHKSRLVDLSTIEEEPEAVEHEKEVAEEKETEENTTPVIEKDESGVEGKGETTPMATAQDMASVCKLPEGIEITYKGFELLQSYSEKGNDYFSLEASEGKKLLLLSFDLKNDSGENQDIDILSQNVKIKVTVNGDYSEYTLTTMLMNDFSTYKDVIVADETEEVVLVIEVDDSMKEDIHSITLKLKNAYKSQTIPLF